MSERKYWQRMRRNRMTRRTLLRASARAGVGATGLALVGCGDDDDDGQQRSLRRSSNSKISSRPLNSRHSNKISSRLCSNRPSSSNDSSRLSSNSRLISRRRPPLNRKRWPKQIAEGAGETEEEWVDAASSRPG